MTRDSSPRLRDQNDSLMNPPDENVLVIRRRLFDELGAFQGLNFEPEKYLKAILLRGNNFLIRRAEAESNPAYKQIIPYTLIVFQDTVLHYVRGKKAGEQRLVAKGSIGIGGHLNDADAGLFTLDEEHYNRVVYRSRLQTDRAEGGKTRSDDHRADISSKKRIACASRNHGDMVADLRGFARPFTAIAGFAGESAALS